MAELCSRPITTVPGIGCDLLEMSASAGANEMPAEEEARQTGQLDGQSSKKRRKPALPASTIEADQPARKKKPAPPFLLWRHSHAAEIKAMAQTTSARELTAQGRLSKLSSKLWGELSGEEQAIYKKQYEENKKAIGYGLGPRKRRSKKSDRPKQPVPPFLLWRHANGAKLRAMLPADAKPTNVELSQHAAREWNRLPAHEQLIWREMSQEQQKDYKVNLMVWDKTQRITAKEIRKTKALLPASARKTCDQALRNCSQEVGPGEESKKKLKSNSGRIPLKQAHGIAIRPIKPGNHKGVMHLQDDKVKFSEELLSTRPARSEPAEWMRKQGCAAAHRDTVMSIDFLLSGTSTGAASCMGQSAGFDFHSKVPGKRNEGKCPSQTDRSGAEFDGPSLWAFPKESGLVWAVDTVHVQNMSSLSPLMHHLRGQPMRPCEPWCCMLISERWHSDSPQRRFKLYEVGSLVQQDGRCMAREWLPEMCEWEPQKGHHGHFICGSVLGGQDLHPFLLPRHGWTAVQVIKTERNGTIVLRIKEEEVAFTDLCRRMELPHWSARRAEVVFREDEDEPPSVVFSQRLGQNYEYPSPPENLLHGFGHGDGHRMSTDHKNSSKRFVSTRSPQKSPSPLRRGLLLQDDSSIRSMSSCMSRTADQTQQRRGCGLPSHFHSVKSRPVVSCVEMQLGQGGASQFFDRYQSTGGGFHSRQIAVRRSRTAEALPAFGVGAVDSIRIRGEVEREGSSRPRVFAGAGRSQSFEMLQRDGWVLEGSDESAYSMCEVKETQRKGGS